MEASGDARAHNLNAKFDYVRVAAQPLPDLDVRIGRFPR